jgi:hypothetical protein
VGYDVGTNTAALLTVNALFHSIVSTHSCMATMATIDIVDCYLGALFPSPESVRIEMCHLSPVPPLPNSAFYLSCVTPTANPFFSAMFSKLSPAFPNPASYPNFVF